MSKAKDKAMIDPEHPPDDDCQLATGPASATPIRRKRTNRRKASRRRKRDDRMAATMVEFAIVANVLFMVIFTCIEFARMNMVRNLTQDAAYFAARHSMVPGATPEEAEAEAARIMSAMVGEGNFEVDVADVDQNSPVITVTVGVDLDDVALFTPMFLGDKRIESTASLTTERFAGFFQVQ